MICTVLSEMGINISPDSTYYRIMGDDSLLALSELIPKDRYQDFLDKFANIAKRRFGAILNVKKSAISDTFNGLSFLGYVNDNTIPKRDEVQLIAQLAMPERYWNIERLGARAVGIAYASCGQSKLVYDVCKNVYDFCRSRSEKPLDPVGSDWIRYLNIASEAPALDTFPSIEELSQHLLRPDHVKRPDSYYWPDHFLDYK
jgi:hypothetical protein